jgi:hypothetical protein
LIHPLDGVAPLVDVRVEAGRASASMVPPQTMTDLVGGLRDDRADLPSAQVTTYLAR